MTRCTPYWDGYLDVATVVGGALVLTVIGHNLWLLASLWRLL
jgi:hypothetical protein